MYLSTTLAIASALAATTVKADSKFSRPPGAGPSGDYRDNPTYKVGEKLDVQWDSDLDRMALPPARARLFITVCSVRRKKLHKETIICHACR